MKQCMILLAMTAAMAMVGGCERPEASERQDPFSTSTDAMTTETGGGYVASDLLADQTRIATAVRKRLQPAVVETKTPEDTHLKDTGLKPEGTGTGTDTGTGTGETTAGTGTGTGTGTDTGTGTGTGTDTGTGTGTDTGTGTGDGGGDVVDPLKDILGGGS